MTPRATQPHAHRHTATQLHTQPHHSGMYLEFGFHSALVIADVSEMAVEIVLRFLP